MQYTETQILKLKELRIKYGKDWVTITNKYNKEFNDSKSVNAIKIAYTRYGDLYELSSDDLAKAVLADLRKTKKTSSRRAIENGILSDNIITKEDILDSIKSYIKTKKWTRAKKYTKPKADRKLNNMTIELLLSDLHYGKITDQFDGSVARDRMRQFISVATKEIEEHSHLFNIDRINLALMGDIIESYTMHGLESASSSEMSNSEQIYLAIESLMEDAIMPLLKLGYHIYVPCVTGNHDRTERDKTYNRVGRNNVTWIIYNTLSLLCNAAGYTSKHITFEVAESPYLLTNIYHNNVLYEHGDLIKNTNKSSIESHIAARQKQLNCVVDFYRMGHYHEVTMYEQGRIIVNGCLTGQDSYADVCGFNTQAYQLINFYIETKERPNCFYKSFPVYLR